MSCNGLSWTPGVEVLLVAASLLVTACETHTPALDLVLERYSALGTGIYEELSQWESVLGEPETVVQTDGGQTFFYWPATVGHPTLAA